MTLQTLYILEKSLTVYKKSKEHWGAWRSGKEELHIRKHQETYHGGDGSPEFMMRVVGYYKSALSRQIGEAVRIGRRGGAGMVLNSKSEFNRCRIPRLIIEEIDEEQIREEEVRELRIAMKHLNRCEEEWEQDKNRKREQELKEARRKLRKIESKVQSRKREQDENKGAEVGKKRKKLKYSVEEEQWGEELATPAPNTIQPQGATTPPPPSPQLEEEEVGSRCMGATLHPGSQSLLGSPSLLQTSIRRFAEQVPPEPAGNYVVGGLQPTLKEDEESFGGSSNGDEEDKETVWKDGEGAKLHIQESRKATVPPNTPGADLEATPSAPSMRECSINRKGYCKEHDYQARKVTISSKKWKDRGGGRGYGWVTQKVNKFICVKKVTATSDRNSTLVTGERFSDYSHQKSRNLDKLEQERNTSGGIIGATCSGIRESDSGLAGNIAD